MDPITSDTKLWEDFKNSEKYALTHIYYLYADPLFRYGKKFSSDNELVKDAIQDLFFDLIRTRDKLGPTDHIYFYLIKAFRRKLLKSLGGTKNRILTDDETEIYSANIVYSIEDEWIQKEELTKKEEIIQKNLAELSPKQREILYYRFTCDLEYEQICEIMSMKYDSARKMVFRALKTLREHLTDVNFTFFLIQVMKEGERMN
ncbi:MAG TPA: sigma-70 family RNA polymerase sigma factor [Paludibacter sp.]|nr:sigma-70 family RNA polymerase sigma factor [Prolixibacteraceae bacterium]